MDQIDPCQRTRRQPGQQLRGVAREQPDVADVMAFDLRQDFCHAVDIGLAADEAGRALRTRCRGQMLAAAETDLELDLAGRRIEQISHSGRRRT